MKTFRLNVIPGDGIGVDVIREGRRVLDRIAEVSGGISFQYHELPWSCEYYLKHGKMWVTMPILCYFFLRFMKSAHQPKGTSIPYGSVRSRLRLS